MPDTYQGKKMKKISLFAITCLGLFIACNGSFSSPQVESSSYTVSIDDVFAFYSGLMTKIEVTIYECNESGAVVYENKCEFDADGAQDFVAHDGATSIKALVEMNYMDPLELAYKMNKKQIGWIPMAMALVPGEKVNMKVDTETCLSQTRP